MIIFYSGSATRTVRGVPQDEPEQVLGYRANVMLSYYLITTDGQKQHLRWPRILKQRRAKCKADRR